MLDGLYDKYGKKKVYWTISIFLIILNIIMLLGIYQSNIRFSIEDQKFKYISQEDNIAYFEYGDENKVVVSLEPSYNNTFIDTIADRFKIEYENKIIEVDSSDLMYSGIVVTFSDGSEYIEDIDYRGISSGLDSGPFEVRLVKHINRTYGFVNENQLFAMPFLALPFILLGLVLIMYPEKMWRIQYMFIVRDGEPTELSIILNRFGGLVLIGFAFIVPFGVL